MNEVDLLRESALKKGEAFESLSDLIKKHNLNKDDLNDAPVCYGMMTYRTIGDEEFYYCPNCELYILGRTVSDLKEWSPLHPEKRVSPKYSCRICRKNLMNY